MFSFIILIKFATIQLRPCGNEGLYNRVLLKLSSKVKLRNFDYSMKMIAVAPHLWFVQPLLAFCITYGVGYCFIHAIGNAKT